VEFDGRFGAELLARGDLLRPWQREDAVASVPRSSGWRVLQRCRIAVLDLDFAKRISSYPEIHGALLARMLRRSRYLAINMAIVRQPKVETRLHMVLWHLADRWGTVCPEGVLLPVKLTHSILSELVAAQRPTVSAALGLLERNGQITRTQEGWTVLGAPPRELHAISSSVPGG
jgi:CRP-like cAMP-binding protein